LAADAGPSAIAFTLQVEAARERWFSPQGWCTPLNLADGEVLGWPACP